MPNRDKLEVGIVGGMRQDLSEHNAPPGTIVDALNVRFSAVGEVEARPGTDALSFASDCDVAYSDILTGTDTPTLARLPGGFFVGVRGFGYRYDLAKSRLHIGGSYSNAEPLGILDVIAREELSGQNEPYPLSQAAVNGYVCTVYSAGNGQQSIGPGDGRVIVHVFTESGTLVTSAQLDSVSAAWVVADGSSSTNMILVTQSATTGISGRVITTSATGATIGAATLLGTLTGNAAHWTACTWPGIGWVLAHQQAATTVEMNAYAGLGVLLTVAAITTGGSYPVTLYATTTHVYFGWSTGSAANARVYSTVFALTSGGTVAILTAADVGPPLFGPSLTAAAANYVVTASPGSAITDTSYVNMGTTTAAGVSTNYAQTTQCTAASPPFGYSYVWVRAAGYDNLTGDKFFRNLLIDFMPLRNAAASNLAGWRNVIALSGQLFLGAATLADEGWYKQDLCQPAELSDGSLVVGIPRMVRDEKGATASLALAEWYRFKLGGARQTAPYGADSLVGGFPTLSHATIGTRHYDSSSNNISAQSAGIDIGFPLPPAVNATVSNGAGSLTVSSAYQWRVVIERIDSDGRRWRSAPSSVAAVSTGAADDTATITGRLNVEWLRAYTLVYHSSLFVMHVYRTVANGSTFYRATPGQGAPSPNGLGVFSFTDTIADVNLATHEVLYTDGGVLNNDCPPSCRFVAATEDRVWLAGLWETEQLQSSKLLVPGEPPQFSDSGAFRVVLPEPCTGIAVQDGVLIAFSRSAVYAVQGGGPNDQGQGAWDSPRCITNSTGCISAPSILVTSVGVFFQSGQGIELLPRGMGEPVFVGMPVQDLMYSTSLGRLGVVTSAAVVTTFRGRTARFVLDDFEGSQVLVYDLDTQAWSRDTYGSKFISAITDTDSGAVLATQAMSGSYGALLEQLDEGQDSVGNTPVEVASSIEWAELRPFGVAGQGRFTGAVALFDAKGAPSSGYRAGNATIKLSVDRFSENGLTFNMNTLSGADYRKNTAATDVGTAGKLTLSTTVGGWRFVGWSVEVDDRGGGRRMGETEQG